MRLTRDVTRDSGRESQTPARTCPSRPCPDRPYRSTSLWSPNIMSSSSVLPGTRDDMMTGLSTIEGIDLNAAVPCSDETHDHAADVIAAADTPCCGVIAEALCWSWIRRLEKYGSGTKCGCGTPIGGPENWLRIIEVLR